MRKIKKNFDWIFNCKKLLNKREAKRMLDIVIKVRKEKFEKKIRCLILVNALTERFKKYVFY